MKSLTSNQAELIDDFQETIRPSALSDFIGQEKMRQNIRIFIEATKKRNETIDHILFYGPPGLGKTTLAQIISIEMGTGFKSTSGPIITKAGDLAAILTNLKEGDILFIDEIHRLSIAVEEMLYSAMEDFAIDIMIGEGPSARSVKINLPKFTLIGATTRFGLLSSPLRSRFGILEHLEFYSHEELAQVVSRAIGVLKKGSTIPQDAATEIAQRSRGTPRIALRMLRRVLDFATVFNEHGLITKEIADLALTKLGIDKIGLDKSDIKYIQFIAENYNGGPVGIETISAGLCEERDSIEDTIETYLIQIGFVAKTPRGRVLTAKAINHAIKTPQNNKTLL